MMKLLTALITCTALLMAGSACAQQDNSAAPEVSLPAEAAPALGITEIRIGTGAQAVDGARVGVHYTGWLYDANAPKFHGKKFDSSVDRGRPIFLVLGEHRVIQGWEQGLLNMKVGGRRTLVIPAELAYGTTGVRGLIPPNATLIFEVELVAVN